MARFLPACQGHRVNAVVRRRGYRPITRTFDSRKEAELWACDVERRGDHGLDAEGHDLLALVYAQFSEGSTHPT